MSERGQISGVERGGEGESAECEPVRVDVRFGKTSLVEGPGARGTATSIHVRVSISVSLTESKPLFSFFEGCFAGGSEGRVFMPTEQ
jgi:hypothetical protein